MGEDVEIHPMCFDKVNTIKPIHHFLFVKIFAVLKFKLLKNSVKSCYVAETV